MAMKSPVGLKCSCSLCPAVESLWKPKEWKEIQIYILVVILGTFRVDPSLWDSSEQLLSPRQVNWGRKPRSARALPQSGSMDGNPGVWIPTLEPALHHPRTPWEPGPLGRSMENSTEAVFRGKKAFCLHVRYSVWTEFPLLLTGKARVQGAGISSLNVIRCRFLNLWLASCEEAFLKVLIYPVSYDLLLYIINNLGLYLL